MVVNQAGKHRFKYTGNLSKGTFYPVGITTESQCQILAADFDNNCIHILDKDGNFLHYIDKCDINCPRGVYVSTKYNLFVAEYSTGYVKKIQYNMYTYQLCANKLTICIPHTQA